MNVSPTTSHDKGTGRDTVVMHTRARLYDPVVMRFTTIDSPGRDGAPRL